MKNARTPPNAPLSTPAAARKPREMGYGGCAPPAKPEPVEAPPSDREQPPLSVTPAVSADPGNQRMDWLRRSVERGLKRPLGPEDITTIPPVRRKPK